MLLVIDVGNTHTVLGVYEGEQLRQHWRLATELNKTADECGVFLRNLFFHNNVDYRQIKGMAISSVVPPYTTILKEMAQQYLQIEPLFIEPGIKTGMPLLYEHPREIGADRIVNAVAGFALYGGPLLIVDFGTATTFCVVSGKGEYLGGAITVGIDVAMDVLFQKTAKLPRIELLKPEKIIGRNTVASMQAGLVYGLIGQVEGIIQRIKAEYGENLFVVVTGGRSKFIAGETKLIDRVDPLLTLVGLKIIYDRNCAGETSRGG